MFWLIRGTRRGQAVQELHELLRRREAHAVLLARARKAHERAAAPPPVEIRRDRARALRVHAVGRHDHLLDRADHAEVLDAVEDDRVPVRDGDDRAVRGVADVLLEHQRVARGEEVARALEDVERGARADVDGPGVEKARLSDVRERDGEELLVVDGPVRAVLATYGDDRVRQVERQHGEQPVGDGPVHERHAGHELLAVEADLHLGLRERPILREHLRRVAVLGVERDVEVVTDRVRPRAPRSRVADLRDVLEAQHVRHARSGRQIDADVPLVGVDGVLHLAALEIVRDGGDEERPLLRREERGPRGALASRVAHRPSLRSSLHLAERTKRRIFSQSCRPSDALMFS
jgi:hypothetical protein